MHGWRAISNSFDRTPPLAVSESEARNRNRR